MFIKALKQKLNVICYDCKFSSKGIKVNKRLKFIDEANFKKININKDITKYQKWMNDKKVHPFSVQRFKKNTIKDIEYVQNINKSKKFFCMEYF